MKRSTRFLPPDKRRDLQQLVALIREQIKQVEMVILLAAMRRTATSTTTSASSSAHRPTT
ncbi:hypothetical protein [Alistipes communis]